MSVSQVIKTALANKGKTQKELAGVLGIAPQSLANKFSRNSFTADDLIKIGDFLGFTLLYSSNDIDIKFN